MTHLTLTASQLLTAQRYIRFTRGAEISKGAIELRSRDHAQGLQNDLDRLANVHSGRERAAITRLASAIAKKAWSL